MTILFDNYRSDPRLETGWGFSCLVEGLEETILFDTGADAAILRSNMRQLGVDPAGIDIVVLSHIHGDHVGGLAAVLSANSDVKVVMPESFPRRFKRQVSAAGATVVEVGRFSRICENAYSTGEIGDGTTEQALAVCVPGGVAVVTGCAHPGVVRMVRAASDELGGPIRLVMGGFHMSGASRRAVENVIAEFEELGVEQVAPCHCSGDRTRKVFEEAYGERFIPAGVGARMEL